MLVSSQCHPCRSQNLDLWKKLILVSLSQNLKHLEMPKADDQMQFQMLLEAARNFATGRGLKLTKDSHDGLMIFNREVDDEDDSDDRSPTSAQSKPPEKIWP